MFGGNGDDRLEGGDGNDQLAGGFGANAIYGNQGDDTIGGVIGAKPIRSFDTVFGGQGNDLIRYLFSNDNASIYGNLGNDTLEGSSTFDQIFGGQGDDSIRGNVGSDGLFGGLGNDTFVAAVNNSGSSGTESGKTNNDSDDIVDFTTGQDKVRLLLNGTDTPGTDANYSEYQDSTVGLETQAVSSYEAHAQVFFKEQYTFIAGQIDGYLVIDANVDGIADGVIQFTGLGSLSKFAFTDII